MLQTKDLLIRLLQKLKPYWDLADWLIALLESEYIDEKTIVNIASIMQNNVQKMQTWKAKEKLQKAIMYMEKLKVQQSVDQVHDQEEADRILDDLENI